MCGGIALAVEQRNANPVPVALVRRPRDWIVELLVMHAGRLTTYMLLGAALGAVGASVWAQQYLPVQRWLFAAGSVMLVLSGFWLLQGSTFRVDWLERLAARGAGGLLRRFMDRKGQAASALAPGGRLSRRYGTGLAWGLVPCGMVYGALPLALLAGNALSGALVMGTFGLGTLPNLLVLSGLSGYLRQWSRRPMVRRVAGIAVIGFGIMGIVRALMLPESLSAHGFCLVY